MSDFKGYRMWDETRDEIGSTKKYQRRLEDHETLDLELCYCNDKLHLNIEVFDMDYMGIKSRSCSIYLCHENSYNNWCDLRIYSLTEEKLLTRLEMYENKLIEMWKIFCK